MADRDEGESTPVKAKSRKRMTVFYGKNAGPVEPERMPREGIDDVVRAGQAKVKQAAKAESGKTVLVFAEPGEEGFSLVYAWYKSDYLLPRHSHDSDCLYYVTGGELRIGSHVLRKGDGMFIPKDHAYGYQAGPEGVEVLEFRNATHFNLRFNGNDEGHWDRIAATFRDRAAAWTDETVPPSDR
jgi:hypothetical protein